MFFLGQINASWLVNVLPYTDCLCQSFTLLGFLSITDLKLVDSFKPSNHSYVKFFPISIYTTHLLQLLLCLHQPYFMSVIMYWRFSWEFLPHGKLFRKVLFSAASVVFSSFFMFATALSLELAWTLLKMGVVSLTVSQPFWKNGFHTIMTVVLM